MPRHNLSLPQHRGSESGGTIPSRWIPKGEHRPARGPKKGGQPIAAPSYPPIPVVRGRRAAFTASAPRPRPAAPHPQSAEALAPTEQVA